MKRRRILSMLGVGMLLSLKAGLVRALAPCVSLFTAVKASVNYASAKSPTLLSAPIELGGDWSGSALTDVVVVIDSMRTASIVGVSLLSDRQPDRLRVDNLPERYPSVWLQTDASTTGWVRLNVGPRDWCKLAYQFGHELGHVFCNSWDADARPRDPCQWIEEALVEAFALRGLAQLADNWARMPPFPNDAEYASSIRDYRESIVAGYRAAADEEGVGDGFSVWFKAHQPVLSERAGLDSARGAVATMLDLLESDAALVEDMGALNRWPGRSGVALPEYLYLWEKSCTELNAPRRLPARIRQLLATP